MNLPAGLLTSACIVWSVITGFYLCTTASAMGSTPPPNEKELVCVVHTPLGSRRYQEFIYPSGPYKWSITDRGTKVYHNKTGWDLVEEYSIGIPCYTRDKR